MTDSTAILEIALIFLVSFLIGAIPFAYLVGRLTKKVDPQTMKAGTVSGTALYKYAGFMPLLAAGILDSGKGILAVEVFRFHGQLLRSLFLAAVVAGHNWSPYLKGKGGRGLAPTLGGMIFLSWPGTLWLGSLFGIGRLFKQTGFVVFLALLGLPLVIFFTHDSSAKVHSTAILNVSYHWYVTIGILAITALMFIKRILGDANDPTTQNMVHRLLYDKDPPTRAGNHG